MNFSTACRIVFDALIVQVQRSAVSANCCNGVPRERLKAGTESGLDAVTDGAGGSQRIAGMTY